MQYTIPHAWTRQGVVLARQPEGPGSQVVGDPCIVWDEAIGGWRMILFFSPPGHGQASCLTREAVGRGHWSAPEPLHLHQPGSDPGGRPKALCGDGPLATQPGGVRRRALHLLTISMPGGQKVVQRASSPTLAGPWTLEPEACLPHSEDGAFDAKHADAVSGYYFPERETFLYFYMGYPEQAQPRHISPYGSAQAVAVQRVGEPVATNGHHPPTLPAAGALGVRLGGRPAIAAGTGASLDRRAQCLPDRTRPRRPRDLPAKNRPPAWAGSPIATRNGRSPTGTGARSRSNGWRRYRRKRRRTARGITSGARPAGIAGWPAGAVLQ